MNRLTGAIAAGLLALSACGGGGDNGGVSETSLLRGIGANPDTVDPHKAEGTWENDVIGDMMIGLFTEDVMGNPVPGMAETWTTSEDGLEWTFTLRDAQWSDGEPVTAQDFVYALRRLQSPETIGAVYSSLLHVIKNAREVNAGQLSPEELGVTAMDDKTLRIELDYPAPYLAGLLKHYVSFPVPKHVVDVHGDAWTRPENLVVNGPYKLTEWRAGDFLRSVKNPQFFDADNVCFEEVIYFPYSDSDAVIRMAKTGRIDLNNAFPNQRMEELQESLPGWPRTFQFMSTTYVAMNTAKAPFDDARVRTALAMSVDRDFVTQEVMGAGQTPSYGFVPDGMNNYPDSARFTWADLSRDERLIQAREMLEDAGFGPDNPLKFEYNYRSTGENPKAAPVLQANWSEIAEWVQPEIRRVETRVLYNLLQQADFQTSDAGWVADYNDPYNFLYLLDSRTGAMNYGQYSNPAYDALMDASNNELDLTKRAAILRQAEQLMLDDAAVIPLWSAGRQYLVNPDVTGFEPNLEDIHRTRYMCRKSLRAGGK